MNKKYVLTAFVFGFFILMAVYAYALDYPHTDQGLTTAFKYTCNNCHLGHTAPAWWDPQANPASMDDTFYNRLCKHCHKDGG